MATEFSSPVFADPQTRAALNWPEVWADFTPVTVYGRRAKTAMQPYLPGQERVLGQLFAQLRADLQLVSGEMFARVLEGLSNWPDIAEALDRLHDEEPVLTPKHLLGLKQFAYLGGQVLRQTENLPSLRWTQKDLWERLLEPFGAVDSASFSLHHVGDKSYQQLLQAHAQALRKVSVLTQEQQQTWVERTGQRSQQNGQLVFNLPEHRQLVSQLKQHPGLRWLRETPFDCVFEVLPSTELELAMRQTATIQQQLEEAAAKLVHQLSQTLAQLRSSWQQAVADLAAFDLRMARVDLSRRWRASVPQLGAQVRLQGGVHPLVARRLRRLGRDYVPLDLDPSVGVNVLFGSNMGGKTVAMSLLAVCQLCVQYGLPTPAAAFETRLFPLVRFCASADSQLDSGLSSFGTEVTRLSEAWQALSIAQDGLLCVDEPGRSTNPIEGEALVVGFIRSAEQLGRQSVMVLASHFSAVLYEPGVTKYRVRGLHPSWQAALQSEPANLGAEAAVDRLAAWMDYRVERVEGQANLVMEALPVAQWLGLPTVVLQESQHFLQRRREL